jgi:hypothetical protein
MCGDLSSQQTVGTKRRAATRARRPTSRRTVNWVQMGSVMRHTSSYTTPRAASAVDRRGARTSEVGRAAGWRAGAGPQDGDRRGWLAAEQRVSEREVGLGCEGASESCRGWATGALLGGRSVADRAKERPSVRRSWAWTRFSSEALSCILCRRMPSNDALSCILCCRMPSNDIHDHYGREAVKPITTKEMNPMAI